MNARIGPLIGADEYLNHQIANTHSVVGSADRSWTEKVWFTFIRKDGKLQATFGLGKYSNRDILDGFAGIMRDTEQRTVRASRVLHTALDDMAVGPLRFEVIEPFHRFRVTLAENPAQPMQFDLTFIDRLPVFFEDRDFALRAGRTASDVVRYHQAGSVSGWILIDGERVEIDPDDWFGFRDHSWGVREHVGVEPTDLPPPLAPRPRSKGYLVNWFVSQITRPDGSMYELAYYLRDPGDDTGPEFFSGYIGEADGRQIPILQLYPELTFRKSDMSVMSGRIHALVRGEGRTPVERVFEIEALDSELGFRLNTALYGAWKGQIHGSFKGDPFVDGECVEDVNNPEKLAANPGWVGRDRPLRIREGDSQGYALIEAAVRGHRPEASFI